jgi:AcrR family transcriptional regulator
MAVHPAAAARSGTTRSGTTRSGTTRSGATRSGTTRSGATRSGTTRSGAARKPTVAPHETDTEPGLRSRASALPAEERRAAILAATVPLLASHGTEITSRQIAAAAGVAEGTIFRVFADKESLIEAAVDLAFDPAPAEAEILAIDPTLDLEARCIAAVDIIQRRIASLWRVFTAVGAHNVPEKRRDKRGKSTSTSMHAFVAILEPDRDQLRVDPLQAADLLRGLTFASCHPALTLSAPMSPREIVSVVLHGIWKRPEDGRSC